MYVENLDIPLTKLTDGAERVIDRAVEDVRRRRQTLLTNEHLWHALASIEWDLFAFAMQEAGLNPNEIVRTIDEHLRTLRPVPGEEVRVSPTTKLVLKLALHHANQASRTGIEPGDLMQALLEETQAFVPALLRDRGVDVDLVLWRVQARVRELNLRTEQLRKRFELPPFLKQFATNLNLLARQDRLPPVYGRDREIQQVMEILSHRERANSVMLIGEPGVGKTAIAEGLAQRLELDPDAVPVRLHDCQIISLQMNAMVAGTMLRGMFEDRMQNVIREVREHPNLVLFVDEAHTMIGAGSAVGTTADAADILKSSLARGEIRMIAATTLDEYRAHVQEDEALARRFRCVQVAEPSIAQTRAMLEHVRPRLERNYAIRVPDEALDVALALSPRYQRHLHLPDKVIGWLDTAAVRAELDGREDVLGDDVVAVVADAAQIPRDMVARDVTDRFTGLEAALQARVVGQEQAVRAVAGRLRLNKGPLKDGFDRPDGVLLFLGPTGVGKTELAKAVAAFLFGDDKKMIRLDMSEYQDGRLGTDKLIGMPRGIVGGERGGVLTNQLRDHPYSVVLLDEIEKADPSVLNLFLQAFDEGWLTDGRGKRVYLSDTIIIMTSNLGSEHFRRLTNPLGFLAQQVEAAQVRGDVLRELEQRFPPEFRNRIDEIVLFDPLTRDDVRQIARQYLGSLERTLAAAGRTMDVDEEALERLVGEGYSLAYGARFLHRVIDDRVKLPISEHWRDGIHFDVRVRDGKVTVLPVSGLMAV